MLSCLKSCRDLHSSDSPPKKKRLNPPITIQRGNMSVGLGGDPFPPRSIKITLPPLQTSGLTAGMQPERKSPKGDGWSDSTPFEDTSSPVDVEEPPEKRKRLKAVEPLRRDSVSLESSRMNSEYYSCSSHFGAQSQPRPDIVITLDEISAFM